MKILSALILFLATNAFASETCPNLSGTYQIQSGRAMEWIQKDCSSFTIKEFWIENNGTLEQVPGAPYGMSLKNLAIRQNEEGGWFIAKGYIVYYMEKGHMGGSPCNAHEYHYYLGSPNAFITESICYNGKTELEVYPTFTQH